MRIAFHVKPPRLVLVLARVIDTNARTCDDPAYFQPAVFDPEGVPGEVLAVESLINPHGHAQLSRTAGDVRIPIGILPKFPHDVEMVERLDCSDKNGSRIVFSLCNRIQTEIKPVDHVDVGTTSLLKHDGGPGSLSL